MVKAQNNRSCAAYSLAELAVVITIIGLLVGVVAAGVNLRSSSELQGIVYGISQYQAAIESFNVKYEDLPGDMVDAHDYWDDGADGVCGTAAQCNGDGDGRVDYWVPVADMEIFRFWQHLQLSGLVDGGYSGVGGGAGSNQADIGINIPETPRSKVGYSAVYLTTGNNSVLVGGFAANSINSGAALTPSEALALDKKTDDGDPSNGQTRSFDATDVSANDCVTGGGAYNTSNEDWACMLAMPIERR